MSDAPDPVRIAQALVQCPTVTPSEGGALLFLENLLGTAGFRCSRADRGAVPNLFAIWEGDRGRPVFGFNGHTDVVPPGDVSLWSVDPFGGELSGGELWGRGATDMKSGIAAFVAAAIERVHSSPPSGSIAIAITGDEEGAAVDGTRALLDWMEGNGQRMDVCLVGEPTSQLEIGDTIKIGRRGSLTARFRAIGKQGHAAYPHLARNPIPPIAMICSRLSTLSLDDGSHYFDPSTIALTSVTTSSHTPNVIPAVCEATVNIRFSDVHSSRTVSDRLHELAREAESKTGAEVELDITVSGESFLTPPGELAALVAQAVREISGRSPAFSTGGGTSDARFITAHCPVVEFGLVGKTMHQIDERAPLADIRTLTAIYRRILDLYFD